MVQADAGKDIVCGGVGDDVLWGGKGKDVLRGGPGKDGCPDAEGNEASSCRGIQPARIVAEPLAMRVNFYFGCVAASSEASA